MKHLFPLFIIIAALVSSCNTEILPIIRKESVITAGQSNIHNWFRFTAAGRDAFIATALEYNVDVSLVNKAVGGTMLTHEAGAFFDRDCWCDREEGTLYAKLIAQGKEFGVDAIVWSQGAGDALGRTRGVNIDKYKENMVALFADIRSEFGDELPIYVILTGYREEQPVEDYDFVRDIQLEVISEDPHTHYGADNGTRETIDGVHLTEPEYAAVAKEVAERMYK